MLQITLTMLIFTSSIFTYADSVNEKGLGRPLVDNFSLLDSFGNAFELHRNKDKNFVVLISYLKGCPIIRKYIPEINSLKKKFKNVEFAFIDASRGIDRQKLNEEIHQFQIQVPILIDSSQDISWELGFKDTAEVRVIETSDWRVIYSGPIDDRINFQSEKEKKSPSLLENVLKRRKSKKSAPSHLPVFGCRIYYDPFWGYGDSPVNYKDVAPILVKHCLSCHKPDGVAPWSMERDEALRPWLAMMRFMVRTKRMPPGLPDFDYGDFRNLFPLVPQERSLLLSWIRQGGKLEPGKDYLAKAMQKNITTSSQPDFKVTLPKQIIPASGPIDYRYLYATSTITEDSWVQIKVNPGNKKVLHHANVFLLKNNETLPESKERFDEYLSTYAPGANYDSFENNYARKLPANAKLLVVVHYQATGKEETDTTSIEFFVKKANSIKEMTNYAIANFDFKIVPFKDHQLVEARRTIPKDSYLHAIILHMHLRGRAISFFLKTPDGITKKLVSVPNYDFNWQHVYVLNNLIKVPAGSEFICVGEYDNSKNNPFNPAPEKTVHFGLQTTDEMLMCHVEML